MFPYSFNLKSVKLFNFAEVRVRFKNGILIFFQASGITRPKVFLAVWWADKEAFKVLHGWGASGTLVSCDYVVEDFRARKVKVAHVALCLQAVANMSLPDSGTAVSTGLFAFPYGTWGFPAQPTCNFSEYLMATSLSPVAATGTTSVQSCDPWTKNRQPLRRTGVLAGIKFCLYAWALQQQFRLKI